MEYITAVRGALCMPASWWIDVLHGVRLSIRDYRVSPRERVRVRASAATIPAADRAPPPPSSGDSVHTLNGMLLFLRSLRLEGGGGEEGKMK